MSAKYIFRLDDASEFMDYKKWNPYFELFDKYDIYPIVAVIPANKDPKLINDGPDSQFWDKVRIWQEKKYVIALHGFQHLYSNKNAGIMGINKYSEFAGVNLEKQILMLQSGLSKFSKERIRTNTFVAPAHSFDSNTIKALIHLNINCISDGFFWNPIIQKGINWIPQQLWKPVHKKRGVWTICLHPEMLDSSFFYETKRFIEDNSNHFINPNELTFKKHLSIAEKLVNYYLSLRFKLVKLKNKLFR